MLSELLQKFEEAPGVWSFYFLKPAGFRHEAGDYAELNLNYPSGGGGRRWFSIASAPHEPYLMITTFMPAKPKRFKRELMDLPLGYPVQFSPPMGNFNLPKKTDKVLFVAGGIGITPYRAMLFHHAKENLNHDIRLLYLSRQPHLFQDIIAASRARSVQHLSRHGRLQPENLHQHIDDWRARIVYLAGPEPLMLEWYEYLQFAEHPPHRIRLSYFPGYLEI